MVLRVSLTCGQRIETLVCSANHESAERPACLPGLEFGCLQLGPHWSYCIAECPQFGWIMGLGKASRACGHAECAVA
jgi:hypothetical protein